MYKYLSLNKEGFNKKADISFNVGSDPIVQKYSKNGKNKDKKNGEPESTHKLNLKNNGSNSVTTAANMGTPQSSFKPSFKNTDTDSSKQQTTQTTTTGEPKKGFKPSLKNTDIDGSNKQTTQTTTGEPKKGFTPKAEGIKTVTPAPSTLEYSNNPNPSPVTKKVEPLPEVKEPTEKKEIAHDPNVADQINIPNVEDPKAKLDSPADTPPAQLKEDSLPVLPLPVDGVQKDPLPQIEIKEPEVLDPNPEPTSVLGDIFSAHHLRNNVLPGVGIAAGIGGLAGALMEDSNPIVTALGTGAGAGAGTLLWDYLSRNEDTQKHIKDFQEWAGKNLWEGADGHVKYLAPALGGLAGLLITK